jgi:hypothetical protein
MKVYETLELGKFKPEFLFLFCQKFLVFKRKIHQILEIGGRGMAREFHHIFTTFVVLGQCFSFLQFRPSFSQLTLS